MTQLEKRQLRRILRIAKEHEAKMFDFVNDLQQAEHEDGEPVNWRDEARRLAALCESLNMIAGLVHNTIQAVTV